MNHDKVERLIKELLIELGESPNREGLKETPKRVAKFWNEFINYDAGKVSTSFESIKTDQLVMLTGIKVYSLCEHHLLPFWCDVSIGYLAKDKVLGISKLARIAHKHAHKLQLQERLCDDIANEIIAMSGSDSVAVIAKGEHTCMSMRGIKSDALMISSAIHGEFKNNASLRSEFLLLAKK